MSRNASKSTDLRTRKKSGKTMADKADRQILYEKAVQCPEAVINFVDETYRQIRGKQARWLREDFCGAAATACEWVLRRSVNHAIGVDLDQEVLRWGREHHVRKLGTAARRIELVNENVLTVAGRPADIVLATNFSFWIFKDRTTLRRYFENACRGLKSDGIMILDAYGGPDASRQIRERTALKGFTFVWHQESYDPITGDLLCHIHFTFPDGSRINKAYTYDWRLWTLPELRELLLEAGFARVGIYWEGADKDGEGNGEYTLTEHGEADPCYVIYIVAEK